MLVETSTLLSSEVASCKMFKNVSENAVDQVVISWDWEKLIIRQYSHQNHVDVTLQETESHPRLKLIRNNIDLSDMLKFVVVSLDDILREVTSF